MENPKNARSFVKQISAVPQVFIDELFEFYSEDTLQTDFVIKLDAVAKWLEATKKNLVQTLQRSYNENIDYTQSIYSPDKSLKKHPRNNHYKLYLLTPDCFKRLCMMSRSKKADLVRTYYIEVEKLFYKYSSFIREGMKREIEQLENNQKPKTDPPGIGYIYVVRAHHSKDLFKIGRTKNWKTRLEEHSSTSANDIEVLYKYQVTNPEETEGCIHAILRKSKYRRRKEIFEVPIDHIKKVVQQCGDLGTKLVYKKKQSTLKGGCYVVL